MAQRSRTASSRAPRFSGCGVTPGVVGTATSGTSATGIPRATKPDATSRAYSVRAVGCTSPFWLPTKASLASSPGRIMRETCCSESVMRLGIERYLPKIERFAES